MSLSLLWTIFFYGWFASEIYIAVTTRTLRRDGKVNDRGTMLLLWLVISGSITVGTWMRESSGPNVPFGLGSEQMLYWLKLASVVVLIAALVLRWTAVIMLGKAFSANVAIRSSQRVRTTGLYRWMRHPSYTGLLFCFVAVGLHTRNWIAFFIVVVPTTAALLYRIHVEEIALREHFGQEYTEYSKRTRRLIPGIY
ncbi:methyltransferase family protein [Acidicapsa ligni]|uniref:methyltransferase family protein n=1 Tax=Acidicapsa ligni TaxID=542300 RepID=UPI0021DFE9A8|nr:isoprenylcysteine carboxylmethyltransferase family protein [Acidicapsa ligni]